MAASIKLRDLAETDISIFYEQQNDSDANRMAAFPVRSRDDFFKHWTTKVLGNRASIAKAIIESDVVAGYVLSWNQDGKQLVGYWIGKEHWGKGLATTALSEFLHSLKIRPAYAFVAQHNIGSIRVLEKCGFKIAEHGKVFSEPHGHEVDEYLMVLT